MSSLNMPLDIFVNTVRNTGSGSAMYGDCEICNRTIATVYVAQRCQVQRRLSDGVTRLRNIGGGTYGCMACLIKAYPPSLVSRESLAMDNKLPVWNLEWSNSGETS
jgi:hypothetical protein